MIQPTNERPVPRQYMIVMESTEFGRETFHRVGDENAWHTIRTLFEQATNRRDGVRRIIGLEVPVGDDNE